jgi:MFS transporter, PAT family, beta-lactamase induction signal transducer AmpG
MNFLETAKGKTVLFTFLYASEGAPIGFIWWALPTLLRSKGVEIDVITSLTAVLILPWVFKFLWAPLIDTFRSDKWGLKQWIISSQIVMGLSFIPILFIDPLYDFQIFAALLFIHAFFAATQDVSIDALAINYVPQNERGKINGFMQAGMLTGRSIFGGGTILLVEFAGWNFVIIMMIIFIWFSLLLVLFVKEPQKSKQASFNEFIKTFSQAFKRKTTWLGIAFALISAASFEATGALLGPYLVDSNVKQEVIGIFFGLLAVAAMAVGGIAGGKISDKIGRIKALTIFLTGVSVIVASLIFYSLQTSTILLISHLTFLYLFIGLFTSASYAFFMDLTDPKLGGTQFSTYMAATNGCESWSGWAGGEITSKSSYSVAFIVMSLVSLLSLLILKFFKRPDAES